MSLDFSESLLVLGALVAAAAALSGLFRGSILNASVLAVAAGVVLAAVDVVSVDSGSDTVEHAIELALILTLFSDGLFVERELLGEHWGPPARALIIAMPVTMGLIALCREVLFPDARLGGVLPARSRAGADRPGRHVHGGHRAARAERHPPHAQPGVGPQRRARAAARALLPCARDPGRRCALSRASSCSARWRSVPRSASRSRTWPGRVLQRIPGGGLAHNYEGVYALGLALLAYGLADVTWGNGLIAAFVAGRRAGGGRARHPGGVQRLQRERRSAIFQAITFFLFGALIVDTPWDKGALVLLAFIAFALLIARPAAVLLALAGTRLPQAAKAVHRLVRPEGRRLDAVRAAGAELGGTAPRARVRDGLVRDHRVDRRPRPDRHGRHALAGAARALASRRRRGRSCPRWSDGVPARRAWARSAGSRPAADA